MPAVNRNEHWSIQLTVMDHSYGPAKSCNFGQGTVSTDDKFKLCFSADFLDEQRLRSDTRMGLIGGYLMSTLDGSETPVATELSAGQKAISISLASPGRTCGQMLPCKHALLSLRDSTRFSWIGGVRQRTIFAMT